MLRSAVLVGCHDVAFRTGAPPWGGSGVAGDSQRSWKDCEPFVPPVGRFQLRALPHLVFLFLFNVHRCYVVHLLILQRRALTHLFYYG
ncbi:hypothetical protein VTN00DRAFT_5307 [Thermoascus crustaceus]|uniref:uncharacterized protein n=1 Tax=Thermoascus crustaceus TaxID=5088 RepID=UPI00374320B4